MWLPVRVRSWVGHGQAQRPAPTITLANERRQNRHKSSSIMSTISFTRTYPKGQPVPAHGLWFALHQNSIIVVKNGQSVALPSGASPWPKFARPDNALLLGEVDGVACFACALPDDAPLPDGYGAFGIRDLYGHLEETHYAIAGYATQMLLWQTSSNYCMNCAGPLTPINGEWGKRCQACRRAYYPPVNPCTITLVHDGDRILMTHKDGWGPRYGLVAGFVEPGETLEDNVTREILEETGVTVTDIQYWRSQPWPFPHQLMCGFYARYVSGEIKIDEAELDDAKWFRYDALPVIPPPLSIARQLIDHWVAARVGHSSKPS